MHRIDSNGTAVALPTPGAVGATVGYFTEGNPGTGTPATVVSADWMNAVQEELIYCVLQNNGSLDKTTQVALQTALLHLTTNRPDLIQNVGLSTSVGASALTINLKDALGSSLSSTNIARISFRSATATTGTMVVRSIIANLSLVIPSGATLGSTNGIPDYLYIWALDNAGTVELGVSGSLVIPTNGIVSSTTISAGATAVGLIYSTTGRSNVAAKLIGRLLYTQATAGTWASAGTSLDIADSVKNLHYETGTFTVNFNGGVNASGSPANTSKTVKFTRIGNVVTLDFTNNMGTITTGSATSGSISTTGADIPFRLRPAVSNRNWPARITVSGTVLTAAGLFVIQTDGNITIQRAIDGLTNWATGTTNNGMAELSVSYTLS